MFEEPTIGYKELGFHSDMECMVIAMSPTKLEISNQKPFSSPGNVMLEGFMVSKGITEAHLTYLIPEYIPNPAQHYSRTQKTGVTVSAKFQHYRDEMLKLIESRKPKVIIAIDEPVMFALVGQKEIQKRRGSPYQLGDSYVIPILKPDTSVAHHLERYITSNDIWKVKQILEDKMPDPHRSIRVMDNIHDTTLVLEELQKEKLLAFDIETSRATKQVLSISFAWNERECIVIPFFESGKGNYWGLHEELDIWKRIGVILENPDIKKITQNGMFDCYFLAWRYHIQSRNIEDTMLMQQVLFWEFKKGLDYLTSIYTFEPYYKDEGKEAFAREESNLAFWEYNGKDSMVTYEIYWKLHRELELQGSLRTYEHQISLFEPFLNIALTGFKMDKEAMKKLNDEALIDLEKMQKEIDALVGHSINPNSSQQLMHYFYSEKGYRPYTKKGRMTTDVDALKRLKAKGDRVASKVLEYRKLKKMSSTYLDVMLDEDNRMRCFWKLSGTAFGRLASAKTSFDTGNNMQNQPHKMYPYMLFDDGYVGYQMDLEQAENRIVAVLAEDEKMIEAFDTGMDIHALTASFTFGIPYEQTIEDDKNEVLVDIGSGEFTARYWGKKANHGLNYGMGSGLFALKYEITMKEAKFFVNKYHSIYPSVKLWHNKIHDTLYKKRFLENPFGRKMFFLNFLTYDVLKEAYACLPQSTVPDLINRGVLHLYHKWNDVVILNQVHDSIVFEIPYNLGWEYHAKVLKSLQNFLAQPLKFGNYTINMPTSIEMYKGNMGNGKEIKAKDIPETKEGLAKLLKTTYVSY